MTRFDIQYLCLLLIFHHSVQECPEETLTKGVTVTWPKSPKKQNVTSTPSCFINDSLATRDCDGTVWTPALGDLRPCTKVTKYLNYTGICPPGFHTISKNNKDYCYKIDLPSPWDDPCYTSGGATVITDLDNNTINSLLDVLYLANITNNFWLPAKRPGVFLTPTWTIPGPNFGITVEPSNALDLHLSLWKNCVALDITKRRLTTESCSLIYPSLCLFINELHYPARCPKGYHTFRFVPDVETCFGIEFANDSKDLSFNDFKINKCNRPMGNNDKYNNDLVRYLFYKTAHLNSLPDDYWCWFASLDGDSDTFLNKSSFVSNNIPNKVIINRNGTISLLPSNSVLPCMGCETDSINGNTELVLEYNKDDQKLYLTVYHPSGLWKYEREDKGIRCFSNVKGPVNVINITEAPIIGYNSDANTSLVGKIIEKVIYIIELPSLTPAEYWCTGHSQQFAAINTDKIVINPLGSNYHVFSLILEVDVSNYQDQSAASITTNILTNLNNVFQVIDVLLMDITKKNDNEVTIVAHLQTVVKEVYEHEDMNILETFNKLQETAVTSLPNYNYTFINLSSATHCLPVLSTDIFTLHWDLTLIGHVATTREFCLQINDLPVTRHCNGSFTYGGYWGDIVGKCNPKIDPSVTTTYLYNFLKGKLPEKNASKFLTEGLNFVLGNIDIIIPADVYFLAIALESINNAARANETMFEMTDLHHMSWVMDRIMSLNSQSLRLAQTLNSTNIIVDTIDNLIELLTRPLKTQTRTYESDYKLAVQPKFVVQTSNPYLSNITGIAISRMTDSNNFTNMHIQPLFTNTTMNEVISINNLEVATWLPESLLQSLQKNVSTGEEVAEDDLTLIITVFYDDSVFQQLQETEHILNSRVIGVSIPGYYSNLKLPMPLIFKEINSSHSTKHCVFWDFYQHNENLPGLWSENGCFLVKSDYRLNFCECYHLTHFGNLILNTPQDSVKKDQTYLNHMTALNIISLVGCFLSLLGIIGIWITALVFQTWRKKPGTKILLNLTVSIALPLIIFVVFNLDSTIFIRVSDAYTISSDMKIVCIVMGSIIHYSILASFLWMLITAILQFIRYVRVLGIQRPQYFAVKLSLIAWGLPAIPVLVVLILDTDNYIPDLENNDQYGLICYPKGIFSTMCVTVPICVILAINIFLFVRIIYAISRGLDGKKRKADLDLVYAQMRLSILLFFLLGLTWIFGLFSFSSNYVWSYLFCLTSTLQGLVLFIYFVVCDPSTRNLWVVLIKPQFTSTASKESLSTGSVSN